MNIAKESKNALTMTNEDKGKLDQSWADTDPLTWEDQDKSTWALQRLVLTEESKNALNISNESKN